MVAVDGSIGIGIHITVWISGIDVAIKAIAIEIHVSSKIFVYLMVIFYATQIDSCINLGATFEEVKFLASCLNFCCEFSNFQIGDKFIDRE